MPGYQETINEFEGISAYCDSQIEELRRSKRNQTSQSRTEWAKKESERLLALPIFGETEIKTWQELIAENAASGIGVAFQSNLPAGYKDSAAESKEWYKSSDIFRIMDEELRGRKDVYFSNQFLVGNYENFDAKKAFGERFEDAVDSAKKGTPTIMPINLNDRHWVGGMLRKNANGELEFIYNDSNGSEIDATLTAWIAEFCPKAKILNLAVKQQNDDHNCGPYSINNLLEFANNQNASFEELQAELRKDLDPKKLREHNAEILAGAQQDADAASDMFAQVKERAICGKMQNLFALYKEEGRMEEGGDKISCDSVDSARELAEQIKKSYEDLGITPCTLEQKGELFVIRLPEQCKGRDPFSMNAKELKELREELQPPSPKPEQVFAKMTEQVAANEQGIGLQ